MKKLIILGALLFVLAAIPAVMAGSSDTIVVTLSPSGTLDITVTAGTWNGAGAHVGDSFTSTTNTTFNINNTGEVECSVNISADTSGAATWLYCDNDTPILDEVAVEYQIAGEVGWTYIGNDEAVFLATLPAPAGSDVIYFGLGVDMPTYSSTNAAQEVTITFQAYAL